MTDQRDDEKMTESQDEEYPIVIMLYPRGKSLSEAYAAMHKAISPDMGWESHHAFTPEGERVSDEAFQRVTEEVYS